VPGAAVGVLGGQRVGEGPVHAPAVRPASEWYAADRTNGCANDRASRPCSSSRPRALGVVEQVASGGRARPSPPSPADVSRRLGRAPPHGRPHRRGAASSRRRATSPAARGRGAAGRARAPARPLVGVSERTRPTAPAGHRTAARPRRPPAERRGRRHLAHQRPRRGARRAVRARARRPAAARGPRRVARRQHRGHPLGASRRTAKVRALRLLGSTAGTSSTRPGPGRAPPPPPAPRAPPCRAPPCEHRSSAAPAAALPRGPATAPPTARHAAPGAARRRAGSSGRSRTDRPPPARWPSRRLPAPQHRGARGGLRGGRVEQRALADALRTRSRRARLRHLPRARESSRSRVSSAVRPCTPMLPALPGRPRRLPAPATARSRSRTAAPARVAWRSHGAAARGVPGPV
jgi:hypothetical protein